MFCFQIYVDKSGLIAETNCVLNTMHKFICNSRPRRFGKSVTADMLTAYYCKGCDSKDLFEKLAICNYHGFKDHLNQYDTIHFDVQWCVHDAGGAEYSIDYMNRNIVEELKKEYPGCVPDSVRTAYGAMSYINATTGKRFVVIIDEWDYLIRDDADEAIQNAYIEFLQGMFKGTEPAKFIALAYMTGILPIKKQKMQSALNNFDEFTMLNAGRFSGYMGFVEAEVRELCDRFGKDFHEIKRWYDGYVLKDQHVYNPKAVVGVMLDGSFQSYWSQTSTFEAIRPFINMDFDGLKTSIIEMLSGNEIRVKTSSFQNDMDSIRNKDDVMTLLIHLGYLAYDQVRQTAFIPNEEIRDEFANAVEDNKWNELLLFERKSNEILEATLDMDCDAVADMIELIYSEYVSVITYINENSLSSVVSIAYLSAIQYYFKPVREFPTGRGFADFVFIPKPEYASDYPALVVELKWNKDAATALRQIRDKNYPESLLSYTGNILMVGINYDKKAKKHECHIERYRK